MLENNTVKDSFGIRIFLLAVCCLLLVGLIGVRLFFLQVVSHDFYSAQAENQHGLRAELTPKRGEIFIKDRFSPDPYPVVTNVNRPLVYVVPQQVKDAPSTAKTMADLLGLDRKEVLSKISDQSKKYVPIAKQISEEKAEQLKTLKLPGVAFEDQIYQNYPESKLASQVLGFVAFDEDTRVGRYGLENYFEKQLAGTPGSVEGVRNPGGIWMTGEQRKVTPPRDGDNLILTLDRAIQFKVEEVLAKTVSGHGAKSGSVIVVSPKTGAVLAMANYPTFDTNKFSEVADASLFNNMSIQNPYEPGSVMKAVTFAASVDAGGITPDMTYDDPGSVTLEKFTIRNSENKTYGAAVPMTRVLEESINTGAIFAEQKIGHKKFLEYLEKFGFGKPTGITLPFENRGSIDNLYRGGDLYPATASFGQGITATPLQILMAYAAIANGGKLMQPYLVEEIIHSDKSTEKIEPKVIREAISSQTASTLAAMLALVVERGHGKRAAVPGYFIAGKTGTAQIANSGRAGYQESSNIGTFAGFGPVDNPQFAIIVRIDEPVDVRFAESTAAPAFGEIAQFILNYYKVPKSR
ncbi:MAG: penicillin-binding protein 2 [bacterium]|nr:penicillin-binding protein 2 [bacterium]